jgi:hypothetical protein
MESMMLVYDTLTILFIERYDSNIESNTLINMERSIKQYQYC